MWSNGCILCRAPVHGKALGSKV
ncbi:unnamed protein product [Cuscuta epithymum]|uniref:Uncharacterized protein n=1 Tax=Cuscuta epithymum TaxID=186058 RepID=A0AAV0FCS0_9ASTE|nr:unnamed protein product [Cuscuta epithymum]